MARHLRVRYLNDQPAEALGAESAGLLRPAALAALPAGLRRDLMEVVLSLDQQRIHAVIGRIAEIDGTLASALSSCDKRLDYTTILDAIEGADKLDEQHVDPEIM